MKKDDFRNKGVTRMTLTVGILGHYIIEM